MHHVAADRVVLAVLEDRRHGLVAADLDVEQRRALGEQAAQLDGAHLERDGVRMAGAVEHSGHLAATTQAADLAGSALGTLLDSQ